MSAGADAPPRLRCLIVDDEAPARDELRYLLERMDGVEVVGASATAEEAGVLVDGIAYDLVLLDIHMPGVDGIEFARRLRHREHAPCVVFTTAHPDHAVEAFETDAVDYLLKPLDERRLADAVAKVAARRGRSAGAADPADTPPRGRPRRATRIPVQRGDRTVFVDEGDVILASAARGYSHLQLERERVLVNFSLADLEQRLSDSFVRVHRSHLVNLDRVCELRPDFSGGLVLVMQDEHRTEVKVARRQAAAIRKHLGL